MQSYAIRVNEVPMQQGKQRKFWVWPRETTWTLDMHAQDASVTCT